MYFERRIDFYRYMFLSIGVVYFLTVVLVVAIRSGGRHSILAVDSRASQGSASPSSIGDALGVAFHLQDFHRVEVKNGKKSWEIKARDAQYFIDQGITQVNDASLIVYREDNSKVLLSSRGARLLTEKNELKKVSLEGDTKVSLDDVTVVSNMASFNATRKEISTPADVWVFGQGFEVRGTGMSLDIDSQIVHIMRNVHSIFEQGQKMSTTLGNAIQQKK